MKTLSIIILLTSLNACAMGAKKPEYYRERKDQDRAWRPCQDAEVAPAPATGKFCVHVCVHRKGSSCREWKVVVKDFNNPDDFNFFRSGSFVLIDEDNL